MKQAAGDSFAGMAAKVVTVSESADVAAVAADTDAANFAEQQHPADCRTNF